MPLPEIDASDAVLIAIGAGTVAASLISGYRIDRFLRRHFEAARALPVDVGAWAGLVAGVAIAWAGLA